MFGSMGSFFRWSSLRNRCLHSTRSVCISALSCWLVNPRRSISNTWMVSHWGLRLLPFLRWKMHSLSNLQQLELGFRIATGGRWFLPSRIWGYATRQVKRTWDSLLLDERWHRGQSQLLGELMRGLEGSMKPWIYEQSRKVYLQIWTIHRCQHSRARSSLPTQRAHKRNTHCHGLSHRIARYWAT